MLNAFTCEGGRLQRLTDPQDQTVLRDAVWIDLLSPTAEEVAQVTATTGLTVPTEADVSEIENSSRLSSRNGALYLSLPLVSLSDGPRTVSAGFVLSPDRLLTVRFAPSRVFDTFAEHLPRDEALTQRGAHILVGLLEAIIDRQADTLEQVRADLDTISHRVFGMGVRQGAGGRKQEDRLLRETLGALGRLGDLISHVRETQVGAARIVPYVEASAAEWLPKDLHPRLRTMRRDIASVSDFDTHLNDKLQFLLDATLGFISIAQNNVMKVLTVVSIVGIPPTLIAGIYGMNFKAMPELDWAWGYPYGLAVIAVSAIVPLLMLRWRGWV
jgi:magnesium transporter